MFEDLFVNICIVTTLVFVYMKIRWGNREKSSYPWISHLIDGFCGGILGLFLMQFSIRVTSETLADMRYIPILLMLLFVGKVPAVISAVLIIISRFLFGVNKSSYAAILMITTLLAGYLIIEKIFRNEDNILLKGMYMVIYSNVIVTIFLNYVLSDISILIPLTVIYWTVSSIGGFTSIFLVNYLRRSEYLFRKYENESTVDFLTGLRNVRNFDSIWKYSKELAEKKNKFLSLLMLDIDHFKRINDTYGHGNGDFVLMEVSRIMEEAITKKGSVFRKGGEEFAIILPTYSKSQAIEIAERIRSRVKRHQFKIDGNTKLLVTISIGITSFPETTGLIENMVEAADNALYRAKENGRNQISL
ncbi:hypothetical protein BKP56_00720 [Marinilactibacillus sp. 15R]|uniref:GGDEF domain-containing protein n=1 Tax=Marinilactibacillus sp. 15R TaxID=1911586 RepID=UPI0009096DFA|nr:diguanylate cyclase [Marinilactibacillus sp. 15R]API87946.1 hypothetical protein BKP56_00720 [Marinilactibacillus sp. 15R]